MISYYNPYFLICTFFGLGRLSKKFPGTVGSIIAIPISYFLKRASLHMLEYSNIGMILLMPLLLIVPIFFIGIYACNKYQELTKQHDSKEIIIDEIVGQSLTILVTVPITFILLHNIARNGGIIIYNDIVLLVSVLLSFILFRCFDIFKPWPINIVDQKVKGGLGVMLDDVLAAIFAIVVYIAGLFLVIDALEVPN